MRIVLIVAIIATTGGGPSRTAGATDSRVTVSPKTPVDKGAAYVLHRHIDDSDGPTPRHAGLIVHFHGAVETIRDVMDRDKTAETVLVVNMPGLSAAYASPFQSNPDLFHTLLRIASAGRDDTEPAFERMTLSCFSAGYGAVREILKSGDADRIDAVVAADSIYAGLVDGASERRVDPRDMAPFLAFARRAAAGNAIFVLAHSAQPTPYASTTETADYLLTELGIPRTAAPIVGDDPFAVVSQADRSGFVVFGHAGDGKEAHLHHLRALEQLWGEARARADSRGFRRHE